MSLVKLSIKGISYSQTQNGAYALILNEVDGERKLPIVIGAFEAQSIAIALAIRFNAPIFTYKNILDKAGIYLKANPLESEASNEIEDILSNPETFGSTESNESGNTYSNHSLQELNELLAQAVEHEDYEKAAKIRDEISKR